LTDVPWKIGEHCWIQTGGGGGYGNPFERDEHAVLDDVIQGYITVESAYKDYAVIIKQENNDYVLDKEATRKLRHHLA